VIEDAACAIGTTYKGRHCGNLGTLGCFSFHPRKVITTGEGGMITTNAPELAERIRLLRSHGGVRTGYWFEYQAAGYNYRLSDVQAAIGVAQMEKLATLIERKRSLAAQLRDRLADLEGIRPPIEPPWGGHIYQSFVILVDERLDRDTMITDLRAQGIETTLGTYAVHDQPFYQRAFGYRPGQFPNSHSAFTRTITLPLYPQMNEKDLDAVAAGLRRVTQERDTE
jgi:dTDP-4-amino-4,6-dideoxygalactose transaminase